MTSGFWPAFLAGPEFPSDELRNFPQIKIYRNATPKGPHELRVAFAVRLRAAQREKQNVQIADDGQEERMVNPDSICNRSLGQRNDCASHDRHDHHARTLAGERPSSATPSVKMLGNIME